MQRISFTKMVASGNDFIVIDELANLPVHQLKRLTRKICDRKYGVGADGLLILEESKIADVKMRIFNADGSEAQMCGNGSRCVALWAKSQTFEIETKAGIIKSEVNGNEVKIKLTDPRGIKLDMPVRVNSRTLHVNFINTGVPHAVIFVEGLNNIDVAGLGRKIRWHNKFKPSGTNADFVEVLNTNSIKVRTYERGVEDETLACGTGAVASALVLALKSKTASIINVHTKGREILKVYFKRIKNKFNNVWLEGKARIVYKGEYYV